MQKITCRAKILLRKNVWSKQKQCFKNQAATSIAFV